MKNLTCCCPLLLVLLAGACDHDAPAPAPDADASFTSPLPSDDIVSDPMFRSLDDFDHAAGVGANPFDLLPPETIARLRESLAFAHGRVRAVDYEVARDVLPPGRYIDLMYMLGFRYSDTPMFEGIAPPHPSEPQPGRDYCALHGPPPLGPEEAPPAIPNIAALDQALESGEPSLHALPAPALRRFRDGLGVNADGTIHTIRYRPLTENLTEDEVAKVLDLFGVDMRRNDYKDYYCASPGTCRPETGAICLVAGCK